MNQENQAKINYKLQKQQNIKDDLASRRLPCAVGIPNSKFADNIGGIIRTCNAFLLQEIVIDSTQYNKYAAVGADKWENIVVVDNVIEYLKEQEYTLIALEQTESSAEIWDFEFPQKTAIIPGHEIQGNSDATIEACDFCIEIPQYGLVESLNVSTATSLALYEYSRQYKHLRTPIRPSPSARCN